MSTFDLETFARRRNVNGWVVAILCGASLCLVPLGVTITEVIVAITGITAGIYEIRLQSKTKKTNAPFKALRETANWQLIFTISIAVYFALKLFEVTGLDRPSIVPDEMWKALKQSKPEAVQTVKAITIACFGFTAFMALFWQGILLWRYKAAITIIRNPNYNPPIRFQPSKEEKRQIAHFAVQNGTNEEQILHQALAQYHPKTETPPTPMPSAN